METVNAIAGFLSTILSGLQALADKFPFITSLLAAASAVLLWGTHRKNRAATVFGHSIQAISLMDQRWESVEMRLYRRAASAYLLTSQRATGPDEPQPTPEQEESLDSVLNFLETIGCFVRMGGIDERTAWQLFGSKAQQYHEASVAQLKKYDARTIYTEMRYLYRSSRVEEEMKDWPGFWIWRRYSALSLVCSTRSKNPWHYLLAGTCGQLSPGVKLKVHFSKEELEKILIKESRLQLFEKASA